MLVVLDLNWLSSLAFLFFQKTSCDESLEIFQTMLWDYTSLKFSFEDFFP